MRRSPRLLPPGKRITTNSLTCYATRGLLDEILKDEDGHIDEIEELQDQISHMTLGVFLTTQTG
jgi:bacterioferritin (cytochrome b1)